MDRAEAFELWKEQAKLFLILRARAGDLKAFVTLTKANYEWNWHHELMCTYLDKFIKGEIKRLMFFLPPRYGKSELVSRRLPAFLHGLFPNKKIISASYNAEMASTLTIDTQRIMDTDSYHEIFPEVYITPEGKLTGYKRNGLEHEIMPFKTPDKYWRFFEGSYRAGGMGGSFTGRGADYVLIDDPFKSRAEADSANEREVVYNTYRSALRSRLEGNGQVLLTHTRWHEDDLAGRLIDLAKSNPEADQWVILSLPAIKIDSDNSEDPRELGEVLWPGKYDHNSLMATKASSGTREWNSLYMQSPISEGGNIIKTEWIRRYVQTPPQFNEMIQVWDFAAKDKSTSDFNVGQVWGRLNRDCYLLYEKRARCGLPDAVRMVKEMTSMFPKAGRKLIEAKANGPAVMQVLRGEISGMIETEPMGDKVARVNAVSAMFEGGNVYYPRSDIAPWIDDHIAELTKFPLVKNDDRVDCVSSALLHFNHAPMQFVPFGGMAKGF